VLIVVRHGRTAANASGLLLGRSDPPLDDLGRAQAALLAPVAASAVLVVCSPLARARETAALMRPDLEPSVDDRWIELDYGSLEGQALRDVSPEVWAAWRSDASFVPGGGESLAALGRRVRSACDALSAAAADADVVVVTHVSPIKAAVAWTLDVDDSVSWRLYVAPASVTRIAVAGRGASLHSFNEVAHLAGLVLGAPG
jgi:broad specificity phosphatase PhoE